MDVGTTATLPAALQAQPRPEQWLAFAADGGVRVRSGKVELGQGIHTALAQIVADELGLAPSQVTMLAAGTDASPDEGVTSGSLSVQDSGRALRLVCAELRARGRTAAARRWQLDAAALQWHDGAWAAADGRRARLAELLDSAHLAAPVDGASAPLAAEDCRVVGHSLPRRDLADKLFCRTGFIHDLELPGLLHGRVLHPPRPGARATGVDMHAVRACAGVVEVLADGALLGILADTSFHADQALTCLESALRWEGGSPWPNEASIVAALPGQRADTSVLGTPPSAPAARTLKARYSKPWIAHASIAPSCALAHWDGGRLAVWSHSQGVFNLRRDLALAFGLAADDVSVQHVEGAGCYGHNGADDVAFDAAWLARARPGQPVRVLWRRTDEMSQPPFGPAMVVELEADLDGAGAILHWRHRIWSAGHSSRPGRAALPSLLGSAQRDPGHELPAAINMPAATGGGAERNAVPGYAFDGWQLHCHKLASPGLRSSALRSLGAFANIFAAESFIDEIAQATGQDALALRRRHLQHDARALAVLDAAAAMAGWPAEAADNTGMGLGCARYKGSGAWCAVVAEVELGVVLRVRRLWIAADVGLVINPDGAAAQLEGGAIQATSWALKEAVRFDRERITSDSWGRYPILRFSEVPAVQVRLLASSAPSLGAGEASLGPTAAAIANALFAALGVRVRELPLTPERIAAAIGASP